MLTDHGNYAPESLHATPATTRPLRVLALLLLALATLPACRREHYRRRADAEAYSLIQEKINDPRWLLPRTTVDVDPRSRMFDPSNPDRPPMPLDDPVSHQLMEWVDGKKGYPHWDKDGHTDCADNPDWLSHLPLDENGVLVLDLDTAIQLALIHSSDYQEEFEDLYLSALDVSAERFLFDTQFFGGSDIFYRASGRDNGNPRSRLSVDSDLVARKAFAAGGNLVASFANSLIWDFHGNNVHSTFSILDFSLVQPFLRGAGRDRALTRLTLAERQLLANVRQMERFRRSFYLILSTGSGFAPGARRIGGLFGGSGLEGFTGVGGGFGAVGGAFTGGGGAQDAAQALQVGGFIGLLQDQQNIRNQQANISGLRLNLIQFQDTLNENLRQIPDDPTQLVSNRLQIAQARQQVYTNEFALLSAQAQYQSTLDDYKTRLGLPPHLCVRIEDQMLDQFNLIDTAITPIESRLTQMGLTLGEVNERILSAAKRIEKGDTTVPTLEWSDALAADLDLLRGYVQQLVQARAALAEQNMRRARADIDRVQQMLPRRRATLIRLRQKYPVVLGPEQMQRVDCQQLLPADLDPTVLDVRRLGGLNEQLESEFSRLERQFGTYVEPLGALDQRLSNLLMAEMKPDPETLYKELEENVLFRIPGVLSALTSDLLDLKLVQAQARADAINLIEVDLPMDEALKIASVYRRDWMNARASLVDTWRAIAFVANDLEATLNLVTDGNISTVGDNPLKFRSPTGTFRIGFEFDAPFTRLLERNRYRQVLIDYQQARRNYYQFIDRVSQSLRDTIRTLELNQLNFESRRLAVLSAIEQIVLNDERQTLLEERGQAQSVTAARDIADALRDLQDAQDAFMGIWVTYEVNRRFLDFNLGTMELDERGIWLDPGEVHSGRYDISCLNGNGHEARLAPDDVVDFNAANAEEVPMNAGQAPGPGNQALPLPANQ